MKKIIACALFFSLGSLTIGCRSQAILSGDSSSGPPESHVVLTAQAAPARKGTEEKPPGKKYLSIDEAASLQDIRKAGFDVDDTLLFSSPAFTKAFASSHKFGTDEFWTIVNTSDRGNSIVKQAAKTIVEKYQQRGVEIYAITKRPPPGGAELKKYLNEILGIAEGNIFFEPDGKTKRIRGLQLDVFFGDSDSDIKDAMEAEVRAIRFQRSPKSSYTNKDGTLRKYHPGMYGEEIIKGSTE